MFQHGRLLLLLAASLAAQTTSTEVLGTVTDPSGALVAGAEVILLRIDTGEKRTTVTTASGDYSFPLIETGNYTVKASAPGFKILEKTGVTVTLQQKARVNFTLQVGATTESMQVVASGVELKSDDAVVGQAIDNRRISELPMNGRNIASLLVTVPGVEYGLRQGFDGEGGNLVPGRIIAVTANGQRELNAQVTIDGVVAGGSQVNVVTLVPSVDAMEQIKVQTSSYSAEYGQNNGAIVQIAMKSGTNKFRGTLFEFLRNDKTSALNYFLNFQLAATATPLQPPRLRRNQFGAFLAGPVILPKIYNGKDRTFWSFSFEALRLTQETVSEAFYFPQEFRNGDFSALLKPLIRNGAPVRAPVIIYDPVTGEPFRDAAGNINNIIPPSRINKNAQNFVNKYMPLPQYQPEDILDINTQGLAANFSTSNQTMFRVDHNLNTSNRVFVRYLTDRLSRTVGSLNPNFPQFTYSQPANLATQYLRIFNPRIMNEFRFGWNAADDQNKNLRTDTDFDIDSLGIGKFRASGNRKLTPRETGIPSVNGVLTGDPGNSAYGVNRTFQITDNLSIIRTSHNFKLGFEWRRPLLNIGASNNPRGFLTCCLGGYNLAGFLLGQLSGSQTSEGLSYSEPRQNRWSGYFQDEWKISRAVTLNIGLRWDYFGVPHDAAGTWRTLRLDVLTQAANGQMLPTMVPKTGTPGVSFTDMDNRYFMPRVGIAWRVAPKWVIRAGGGWFANGQQLDNFQILSRNPPNGGVYAFTAVTDAAQSFTYPYAGRTYNISTRKIRAGTDLLTLDDAFPGQGSSSARANVILMPRDNKQSTHVQWSFDIQRQLPWNSFLTVAYIGSKTSHIEINEAGFNDPDPSPNTDINSRRPYQAYVSQGDSNNANLLGRIRYLDSYANGTYNGLQNSLEKRYSSGFTVTVNYTFSKSIGEGYERNGTNYLQNPRDRRGARSRYPFDTTHNSSTTYVYDIPFFKRSKGLVGAVLGGWQQNGIITFRSGFPFSVNGGTLNTGGDQSRPDRVGSGSLGDLATRQRWFDVTAFRRTDCNIPTHPEICHYGNAGNFILDSPGTQNLNLSMSKNWKVPQIGEEGRLQFRAEFFNALNHPNFGEPNGLGYVSNDSIVPDAVRQAEVRSLRLPMRVVQFGMKLYF